MFKNCEWELLWICLCVDVVIETHLRNLFTFNFCLWAKKKKTQCKLRNS